MKIPQALTIAGSDSSGGAGIQADLKTFHDFGVYGASVITSVTAQNTKKIVTSADLSPNMVAAQLSAVLDDLSIGAVKTGMVSSAAIIEAIAEALQKRKIKNLVLDPAMVSKSGYPLLKKNAVGALKELLLPLALLVTPNVDEAEILSGMKINSALSAREAAAKILSLGPCAVLIKGGHFPSGGSPPKRRDPSKTRELSRGNDIFDDGKNFRVYHGRFVKGVTPHGTGCVHSAAIAANLALGKSLPESIRQAKLYIEGLIGKSRRIGKGYPCLL